MSALYPMNGQGMQPLPQLPVSAVTGVIAEIADAVRIERPSRKYRNEIPYFVYDLDGLTKDDRTLFHYYSRVCGGGDGGRCYQSMKTIAKMTGLSVGAVSESRVRLVALNLIVIIKRGCKARQESDTIAMAADLWERNAAHFAALDAAKSLKAPPVIVHPVNQSSSPTESKKQNPKDSVQSNDKKTTATQPGERAAPVVASMATPLPETEHDRLPHDEYLELVAAMSKVFEDESGSVAKSLIRRHGGALCRQQLQWLPYRDAGKPGGMLRRSIEHPNGYSEPAGARDARLALEKATQDAARRAEGKTRRQAEQERAQRLAEAFAAWKAKLTPEHHAAIQAEALEAAKKIGHYRDARRDTIRVTLVEREAQRIMREWFERETTNDA